jgi:GNAT superfamily N-acetyltransferase
VLSLRQSTPFFSILCGFSVRSAEKPHTTRSPRTISGVFASPCVILSAAKNLLFNAASDPSLWLRMTCSQRSKHSRILLVQGIVVISIRLGDSVDIDAAVSVYERSNLAYRQGIWRNRAASVERAKAHLHDPASWFLLAYEGTALIGMASVKPLRGEDGAGSVIPGGCFLSYLFIVPERWGQRIGGIILDAVLAEAKRRHFWRIHLRTHEDNQPAQRLYCSRGFSPTGRSADRQGEWAREI